MMNKFFLDFLSIVLIKSKIKKPTWCENSNVTPTLLASLNKTNELNVTLGST